MLQISAAKANAGPSELISGDSLLQAASASASASPAGAPILGTQASNGAANATASLIYGSQVGVDRAATYIATVTRIGQLVANANLPCGSTIYLNGQTTGGQAFTCLATPAAQRVQGYTYTNGVSQLCCPTPTTNTLTVGAALAGPAGSATISASQLSSAAAALIQQSSAGSPTQATQASNGPANATAAFTFSNQASVDSATLSLGTVPQINSLAAAAGLPCGSTVFISGQSSSPLAFTCLPVPSSQRIAVSVSPIWY